MEPSFKVLDTSNPLEFLEYVGRVAHKSESKGNPMEFLTKLIDLGHYSVFEHYWICGREMAPIYTLPITSPDEIYFEHPFSWKHTNSRPYVSMFNVRELVERGDPLEHISSYWGNSVDYQNPWFKFASVEIVCSRACSHQIVRHRWPFSYMQESQRHVKPDGYILPESLAEYFEEAHNMFDRYSVMVDCDKIKKEDARYLLPNATATRLIMTAPLVGWNHFFAMRAIKTKGNAPQAEIHDLASGIMEELKYKYGSLIAPKPISFKS